MSLNESIVEDATLAGFILRRVRETKGYCEHSGAFVRSVRYVPYPSRTLSTLHDTLLLKLLRGELNVATPEAVA